MPKILASSAESVGKKIDEMMLRSNIGGHLRKKPTAKYPNLRRLALLTCVNYIILQYLAKIPASG